MKEVQIALGWARAVAQLGKLTEDEQHLADTLANYLGSSRPVESKELAPKRDLPAYLRVRAIKVGYEKELKEAEPGSAAVQTVQRYDAVADAFERLLEVLSED